MSGLFGRKKKRRSIMSNVMQQVTPLPPIAPNIPSSVAVPPPAPMPPITSAAPVIQSLDLPPLPIGQAMQQTPPPTPPSGPPGVGSAAGQGVSTGGGGSNPAQFPFIPPAVDEPGAMPQPIAFSPNSPTPPPQVFPFGSGLDAEEFAGDFSQFDIGPGGITGFGGRRRGNMSEQEFLRSLIQSGLFG